MNKPDYISESLETIFWVTILKLNVDEIQHFSWILSNRIRIRTRTRFHGLMTKLQLKKTKKYKNKKLPFTIIIPRPPKKNVQATGEAFSPQRRTSSNSNMKFTNFF